jgi:iron complex outermembrane recepter protein
LRMVLNTREGGMAGQAAIRLIGAAVVAAGLWAWAPGQLVAHGSGGPPETGSGIIAGVVLVDGVPVRGALVTTGGGGRVVLTCGAGRFQFHGVPEGPVVLRVETMGYRSVERRVEVVDRSAVLIIELEPDPIAMRALVATATPLRGGVRYQAAKALDAEALQRRSAQSLGQILDGEPGVSMRSMGPAPARPVIRGLDGDRILVLANGQRMGDFLATGPDHAVAMDPLTTDRVEVVRGPASLLYGSSALGGVVNLLREDIPRSWTPGTVGGERWAGTGRLSFQRSGDMRAPGTEEGRLVGTHSRRLSGAAGLGFSGDRSRGGFSLDFLSHDFGIPEEIDDPDEEIEIRSSRQRLAGEMDWRRDGFLDQIELRMAATRFFQQEVEMEWEPVGSYEEGVEHELTRQVLGAVLTAAHGSLGPIGQGAVGLSLLAQGLAATGDDEFHPAARSFSAAAFLFEEVPVSRRIRLQAGARFETEWLEARPNEKFPDVRNERTAFTVSGSMGAHFRPAEGLEVGAQLARAHRAPLVEERYAHGPHLGAGRYEIGDPDLPNEIGHGLDLFARYGAEGVVVELTGFINRIDNFIITRATGEEMSGLPVHIHEADAAELVGGEASLDLRALPGLTLRSTADMVRGSRRDAERTPLPYMPPVRAMLEAEYDGGTWWLGGRGRTAAAQNRVAHEDPTDGYTVFDLQAGLRPLGGTAGHTVVLRVENLLDTVYRDHLSRVEERRYPMPGRNISLSYRWRF